LYYFSDFRAELLQLCKIIGCLQNLLKFYGNFFYFYGQSFTAYGGRFAVTQEEETMGPGRYPEEKRVLYFFIELACHSKDYFNEFCDDEHGYCGLYDYVETILEDKDEQTAENMVNALTGIKMAINSDERVKAFFEHSIDKATGLRYPALIEFLLKKARKRGKKKRNPSLRSG
jgi:hypothetical protein